MTASFMAIRSSLYSAWRRFTSGASFCIVICERMPLSVSGVSAVSTSTVSPMIEMM